MWFPHKISSELNFQKYQKLASKYKHWLVKKARKQADEDNSVAIPIQVEIIEHQPDGNGQRWGQLPALRQCIFPAPGEVLCALKKLKYLYPYF